MEEHALCELCGKSLLIHESFVVRIDVFADPTLRPISSEELEAIDSGQAMQALLKQMETMSTDELQDGVHRRFEYRLCPACQREFLGNPLGKPRASKAGGNSN